MAFTPRSLLRPFTCSLEPPGTSQLVEYRVVIIIEKLLMMKIGVFAVASMMVGAAKLRLAPTPEEWASGPGNGTTPPLGEFVSVLEFTSALTMAVGIVQVNLFEV